MPCKFVFLFLLYLFVKFVLLCFVLFGERSSQHRVQASFPRPISSQGFPAPSRTCRFRTLSLCHAGSGGRLCGPDTVGQRRGFGFQSSHVSSRTQEEKSLLSLSRYLSFPLLFLRASCSKWPVLSEKPVLAIFFFQAYSTGLPRWSPIQVRTRPDPAELLRSDAIGHGQRGRGLAPFFRGGLQAATSLDGPSSENAFILPSFLKDIFAGFRIPD